MRTRRWPILILIACSALCQSPGMLPAAEPELNRPRDVARWWRSLPNGKNDASVLSAFQQVLESASAATVRIACDGQEVALGTVVDPSGYLVTKASVLHGKIVCRFKDGAEKAASVVGEDSRHDLALLRVEAAGLPTVVWREGPPPPPGSFVATTAPANQPVAIGVVSSELRTVAGEPEPRRPRGWLGIGLSGGPDKVVVASVMNNSPATRAGIQVGDEILQIDGEAMTSVDQTVRTVGGKPFGKTIKVAIRRDDKGMEISAELARPRPYRAPQDEWGGGPFSDRRSGFPAALPHDTPLHPRDCGGPLVDTDGRAVGINIARALRVTTYALPAGVVRETVNQLREIAGK